MLRKEFKVQDNVSNCTGMILKGAKKRRAYAISAIKTLNSDMGMEANINLVKWLKGFIYLTSQNLLTELFLGVDNYYLLLRLIIFRTKETTLPQMSHRSGNISIKIEQKINSGYIPLVYLTLLKSTLLHFFVKKLKFE